MSNTKIENREKPEAEKDEELKLSRENANLLKRVQQAVNVATEKAAGIAVKTSTEIVEAQMKDMLKRFSSDLTKVATEMEAKLKVKDDFRPVMVIETKVSNASCRNQPARISAES